MKKGKISLFCLLYLVPFSVMADDFVQCGNDKMIPLALVSIVSTLLSIIKIIVPIILVISGMISFFKVTISSKVTDELDKAKSHLIRNIIAALVVFLIFPIINTFINFFNGSDDLNSCLSCFIDSSSCPVVSDNSSLCPGILAEGYVYDENCNLISKPIDNPDSVSGSGSNSGESNGDSTFSNPTVSTGNSDGVIDSNFMGWDYRLYTPSKVDSSKPLIVYLHGNGDQGHDFNQLLNDHGFAYHIANGSTYPAYILMPHLPSNTYWLTDPNKLIKLIDKIVNDYGIDKNRISLTGFSLGADSIPSIINSNPNYFASTVIMSIDHPYDKESYAKSFKNVPTWIFYGESDPYAGGCQSFYEMLINNGVDAKIKVYQNQGHAKLPGRILDDKDDNVIDWILSKKK